MSKQPSLHTDRLLLRPLRSEDAPIVQELAADRRIAEGTFVPHPYEERMAEDFIEETKNRWEEGKQATFAVILKEEGDLIGTIGLKDIDKNHRRTELGYWIGVPWWGNGFATEAGKAMLRFAFKELDLNKVVARHFYSNPKSGNVLKKLGMQKEGLRKEHVNRMGEMKDLIQYGILKKTWKKAMRQEQ